MKEPVLSLATSFLRDLVASHAGPKVDEDFRVNLTDSGKVSSFTVAALVPERVVGADSEASEEENGREISVTSLHGCARLVDREVCCVLCKEPLSSQAPIGQQRQKALSQGLKILKILQLSCGSHFVHAVCCRPLVLLESQMDLKILYMAELHRLW